MAAKNKAVPAPNRYVDVAWVAEYLGVNERWVRRQRDENKIPGARKFGKYLRFDRLEIEAWAASQGAE